MSEMAKQFILETVQKYPVTVFSKLTCPFCTKAKEMFNFYELPKEKYTIVELDGRPDEELLKEVFQSMTGARTVPRIFINGQCIGGCDNMTKLHQSGELGRMLEELGLMSASALTVLLSLIRIYPVVIFSQSNCRYCTEVKDIFQWYCLPRGSHITVQLDREERSRYFKEALHYLTGLKTVPQVFIGGQFIGDAEIIKRIHCNGVLQEMLSKLRLIQGSEAINVYTHVNHEPKLLCQTCHLHNNQCNLKTCY
ncbi:Glutaredoxin-C6 [Trichinella papuae]|uniref:Glutaredoxin-C6 n=1 Tax=Trichinella papuae TaxID=268474 RepID=A0A0V1MGZ4_9BILA|nr:Glutaredoxin-C6 [Trichinella papuae]